MFSPLKLFSLLALPVGTAAMLLGPDDTMAGSVGELYRSVESLERSFTQPGADMDALLLRPAVPPPAAAAAGPLLLRLRQLQYQSTPTHAGRPWGC